MKKYVRMITMLLSAILVLGMAACGQPQNSDTPSSSNVDTEVTAPNTSIGNSTADQIQQLVSKVVEAGFVKYQDFNTDAIDTSRKSTFNSDERLDKITLYSSNITNLLPFHKTNAVIVRNTIYEALFDNYGYNGGMVPVIAKDYENGDNETTVTIYDYVYDTDGNNITASDVKFSYEQYLNSGYAEYTAYLDSIEVVDQYTVKFIWANDGLNVNGVFESLMSRACIFSEKAWNEHDFNGDPVVTGPYTIGDYVSGAYYEFVANENYWQADELCAPSRKRNVDVIHYDVITDDSMKLAAFTSGQVAFISGGEDLLADFMPGGSLADVPEYSRIYQEGASFCMLLPNCSETSPMSDINLRLAVYYALDGAMLAEGLSYMTHTQCFGMEPPLSLDYIAEWDSMENYQSVYSLELAKQYLEKSSYNNENLKILVKNHLEKVTVCEVVQQLLQTELGLNVELVTTAGSTFTDDVAAGDWDIVYDNDNAPDYISYSLNSRFLASNFANNKTMNFIDDPVLQEKLTVISNKSTCNEETLTDLHNYMLENAYGYGICCTNTYYILADVFASMALTNATNNFYIGACEYYLE